MGMHKYYRHLSRDERVKISCLLMAGRTQSQVADTLGRNISTISREVRRNKPHYHNYYLDGRAQATSEQRRKQARQHYRLKHKRIRDYVESKIGAGWSPEIITGRIKLDLPGCTISHESIYQYIYQLEEPKRTKYINCLPRRHRRRRKRGTGKAQRKSRIPNRIPIAERPAVIEARKQMGHWEGDSMVSSRNTTVLYTLVERKTRMVRLVRIRGRDGKRTAAGIIKQLRPLPARARRTLTLDNGVEHTRHEKVTKAIGTKCYFCDPYSAWQRGTNENRNGIVRRYFPKGTDFAKLTKVEIERVELTINTRPMKCLGFKTPSEAAARFVALRP